jgi:hypothetical protein
VASVVGRQTPLPALVAPLVLVWLVDGRRGLRETWAPPSPVESSSPSPSSPRLQPRLRPTRRHRRRPGGRGCPGRRTARARARRRVRTRIRADRRTQRGVGRQGGSVLLAGVTGVRAAPARSSERRRLGSPSCRPSSAGSKSP